MTASDTSAAAPAVLRRRPILVTGGAGFIGSNLVDRFASEGHDVLIYDALARSGVDRNLEWLKKRHPDKVSAVIGDVRDEASVTDVVRDAQAVFHMAAQVAVTTSLVNPREDFEINVRGTLNVLDALRQRGERVPLIFASTNKVYGDLADVELEKTNDAYKPRDPRVRNSGIGEGRPLDFHTPYGCSKGAADQYVLDYARSFGIPTCVMRMSCIYGQRQMGTEDQGWVAHFLIRALQGEPITIYGDGCQVRDVLDISDAVSAYASAWRRIDAAQGRAFNLGGGPSNAISLRQLLTHIEEVIGRPVETIYDDWRAGDQRYYVSDTSLATRELGLKQPVNWLKGVAALARWLQEEHGRSPSGSSPSRLHKAEAL
ncbi:SDR family NAD(P)-dependent oxidoreductase [Microvirga lotononidis]|uniref:Nucleoside-diphosphate-sugar epimerase n=1 Tax=Microvirga lotononidis TaxID=864069 RepID=I4YLX0_9HYPH|nr:SDR family NAD(P)-dependent oxidoreductase [Microvirga lotononidis]EIM24962.1 nucleoside-diphosphate-sugar epimerase [Microvirga lotononidis]WQO29542.1 SDR family NAD(P)-dependent oxidoreductase [Microvirga lotononidis]